ncbi:MAG: prepilin-type N-terminal cleavage/methylation domain-containing protein [Sutterella sp.]|nr:prepilin-type N-terminal cleavage/methylation domain-containing protein [Sutterella sp.]
MTSFQRRSAGFTLIEICMVLVLLGILAAVAVPKFFDLQDESRQRAAVAAIAEAQSRINAAIGQKLVEGFSCADAVEAVNEDLNSKSGVIADKPEKFFGDYQLEFKDLSPAGLSRAVRVSYMGEPVAGGAQLGTLVAAQCSGLGNPNGVSSLGNLMNVQDTAGKIIATYDQANSNPNVNVEDARKEVKDILAELGLKDAKYWRLVKGNGAANLFITHEDIKGITNIEDAKTVPFIQVRQTSAGIEYYVGMVGAAPVSGNGKVTLGGLLIHDNAEAKVWADGGSSYGGDKTGGSYYKDDALVKERPSAFTNYQDALAAYQKLL